MKNILKFGSFVVICFGRSGADIGNYMVIDDRVD